MEPPRVEWLPKGDSTPATGPGEPADGGGVPVPIDELRERRARKPSSEFRMAELSDFSLQGVLGQGEFGTVMMAIKHDTQKVYAIKVLQKDHIVHRGNALAQRASPKPKPALTD